MTHPIEAAAASAAPWSLRLLRRVLVPLMAGLSLASYIAALWRGVDPAWAVTAAAVATVAVALVLERRLPFRTDWRRDLGDRGTDLVSAATLVLLVDPLANALASLAASTWPGAAPLSGWPLWAQVLAVLLLAEAGYYAAHRLHHGVRALWWLHALHHSSERLYWLNGLRLHPLNHLANAALGLLPVLLLGASPEAVLGYLAISQPVVLLQHANIDLRHGRLNALFSTPEAHRWHHGTQPHEANHNFGRSLLLWDHLFGTYRRAEGFGRQHSVGLFDDTRHAYPGRQGYLAQVLSMCRPGCCAA